MSGAMLALSFSRHLEIFGVVGFGIRLDSYHEEPIPEKEK